MPAAGQHHTPEARAKIAQAHRGRKRGTPWNKGLTKATDSRVAANARHCEPGCICERHSRMKRCPPGCQCGKHSGRPRGGCAPGCACGRHGRDDL